MKKITPSKYTYFIALFYIAFLLVLVSLSIAFYNSEHDKVEQQYKIEQKKSLELVDTHINSMFEFINQEVVIMSRHRAFVNIFEKNEGAIETLTGELEIMSRLRGFYDQIRYIDEDGYERVRINNSGSTKIVDQEDLQFKGDRYYYTDSVKLPEWSIYLSPFDLNIEGGEIEHPYKPMIRIATPLYYKEESKGVFIVNYRGDDVINTIKGTTNLNINFELLNREGYWLSSVDEKQEWGFMFEDKEDEKLPIKNSELWEKINTSEDGQFELDGKLYAFTTIYPAATADHSSTGSTNAEGESNAGLETDEYFWKILSIVDTEEIHTESNVVLNNLLAIDTFVFIVITTLFFYLRGMLIQRQKNEEKTQGLNDLLIIFNKTLRHDLANFFTAIKFSIENYRDDQTNEKEIISDIERSAKGGIKLIQEMREFKDGLKANAELKTIELNSLLKEIAQEYKIDVSVEGEAKVKCDFAIKAAVRNLINNVIRHGKADKVDIIISDEKNNNIVTVSDNGIGIDSKIKKKLFTEGFSYGASGNTGMGLYIVKKTMQRYDGDVEVLDNEPTGAKFKLIFKK